MSDTKPTEPTPPRKSKYRVFRTERIAGGFNAHPTVEHFTQVIEIEEGQPVPKDAEPVADTEKLTDWHLAPAGVK